MNTSKSKIVLIVDDCSEIQTLLKTLLGAHGFQVRCADNGEDALQQLNSVPQMPDAILLDVRMPIMNGLAFLEKIQDLPSLNQIPVVLMSGDQDLEEKGAKTRASVLIKKPLSSHLVLAALSRVLAIESVAL
jgi:CheY-like chemotaxis protein